MSQVYYPQCRAILSVVFDGFGIKSGIVDPFSKNGGDSDPTVIKVIPRASTVNLTGYKEADTWSLDFDAKALPISPDLVRAINVEIYMFDAKSVNPSIEDFAQERYLLCAGVADNSSLQASSSGREFSCDGRDYTALLIDKHWDPRVRVPTGVVISQAVQDIVDLATQKARIGRTLSVQYVCTKPEPVVGAYRTKTNKKGKPVKAGETAWDVIYKMCLTEGLIVFVRGFNVIITDPQTLTLQNANKARKVAYGRNLSSLKIDRKLGKEKAPQVEVTCYSSKQRGSISARFPEGKDQVTTGIGTKQDDRVHYVVEGIDDITVLKRYAETQYNNLARGEAKIHFSTKSLTDLTSVETGVVDTIVGGSATESTATTREPLSMLELRAGDPVVIGFDPFNEQVMESSLPEQRYQMLRELGYSQVVSKLISTEYERIDQFKRPFYTRSVQVDWSSKEGVTIDVEAVNFVSAPRDDASGQAQAGTPKLPKATDNSNVGK